MRFETWVGFRYLISKRSSVFVTFISVMTVLGVVLGVAALNVTLAVMSGFEEDLKAKIIGMNAHAVVLSHLVTFAPDAEVEKKLRETKGIVGVTPFTYNELLMQRDTQTTGVIVKGADPKTVGEVTDLINDICLEDELGDECGKHRDERAGERRAIMDKVEGEYEINESGKKVSGILLGRELADTLVVVPGETVHLVAPSVGGAGGFPKVRTFYIVGTFRTGMWEYDQKFCFTSIAAAQKLSGDEGNIAGYEVKTTDVYRAPEIVKGLQETIGYPFVVKSWVDLNGALFGALKLEKFVMGLLLSIIVVVASFSIVSILTLIVLEKAKEIAILKSMGASDGMILGIFAVEGFTIGTVGVLIGSFVGWAIAKALQLYGFPLDVNVYYLDSLPVNLEWANFVVVGVIGLLITFAAALMPSIVAARQNPVQGLQYD